MMNAKRLWLLFAVVGSGWAMESDRRGSLKRRVERALQEADEQEQEPASSSAAGSSGDGRRQSLRRRTERARGDEQPTAEPPLVQRLQKRWGEGRINNALVQEFAVASPKGA